MLRLAQTCMVLENTRNIFFETILMCVMTSCITIKDIFNKKGDCTDLHRLPQAYSDLQSDFLNDLKEYGRI